MYIVFEGLWGSGKSTISRKVYLYLKKKYPKKKVIWLREPGGTEISEAIRKLVQGTKFKERMFPITDAYLYAASRAQLFERKIRPILKQGGIVVSDRSFISSLAIQGYGSEHGVENVLRINLPIFGKYIPDVVFYIDKNLEDAIKRTNDKNGDKFERSNLKFMKRVDTGYKRLSKRKDITKSWININANISDKKTLELILENL